MKNVLSTSLLAALLISSPALAQQGRSQKRPQPSQSLDSRQPSASQDTQPWSKGGKVPKSYQSSQYTVTDWQHRNLRAPAKGSHWVRNDSNQYALTNRSGTISELVGQGDYPDTHRWARGERIPGSYRNGGYVVNDWQAHHLTRPRQGYHWVHVNNQYLLIAIATGLIGSLIANGQ